MKLEKPETKGSWLKLVKTCFKCYILQEACLLTQALGMNFVELNELCITYLEVELIEGKAISYESSVLMHRRCSPLLNEYCISHFTFVSDLNECPI